nr:reverse transcriptase domain-containing protein [Tanacetum cinerariifolium]
MQNQINVLRGDFNKQEENLRSNSNDDMRSILGSFFKNQASTSGVERDTEEITDKEHSNCQGSTAHIQSSVVPISILEPDVPKTQPKPNIPYPSRLNDQKLREKTTNQMENLLTNKDKLFELAKVPLNKNCSAMLFKKLPKKLRDPGKLLIPCDFPGIDVCHALADLGASINLMPLSIWKTLSLPELTPTRMTLELADRSITRPKGVDKVVSVKVGKFHFPTDFVVVDIEADPRVPLILGRSFLRTSRALTDVYGEKITLSVNDESVTFNRNQTMRYSLTYDDNSVNRVDVIDIAYKLPVIIAKDLKDVEKEVLIKVLKSQKRAIAWKISDIKGIDLRFCTHKILMEEDYKPAVQSQRRVNLKIHDVIKKEVIKLLDAGTIYPISDSPWVEVKALPTNDARVVVKFLKSLFSQFRISRAIISDCGTQFIRVMIKYGVSCHSLPSSDEWSSGGLQSWIETHFKEDGWGKPCLVALKHVNFDLKTTGDHRKLQLNELNELRDQAYENFVIYKERTKKLHDSKIKNRIFGVGDQVLLFNSRLKIFLGKLKTRWSGPFTIIQVFPYGTVELSQPNGPNFKVNGHRVKHYFGGDIPSKVVLDLHTFPMDK